MSAFIVAPSAVSVLDSTAVTRAALAWVRPRHWAEISDFSRCSCCTAWASSTWREVRQPVKAAMAAMTEAVTTAGSQILVPRDSLFMGGPCQKGRYESSSAS